MILKLDTVNKTIIIEGPVNLREFLDEVWEYLGEEEDDWTIVPDMVFTFVN